MANCHAAACSTKWKWLKKNQPEVAVMTKVAALVSGW